jgi:uncharacterized membrane protein
MKKGDFKKNFITGLIVLMPIMLTIVAIDFFISIILAFVVNFFPFLPKLPFRLEVILTVFFLLILTLFIGFLVNNMLQQRLQKFLDSIFLKIPVIKYLYGGTKQVTEAMLSDTDKKAFKRVVLVPFPSQDVYSLGFVTQEEVKFKKDYALVFIPQAPLPNNGYVVFAKKSELKDPKISVNDAIKIIFSGGIVDPDKDQDIKNI